MPALGRRLAARPRADDEKAAVARLAGDHYGR